MDGVRDGQLMHLGAFLFNLGNHVAAWRHSRTPTAGLLDLGFYAHLAGTAERGCFDFVFHSDGVGINDTYPEIIGHTVTVRPEPTTLLSALAALTSRRRIWTMRRATDGRPSSSMWRAGCGTVGKTIRSWPTRRPAGSLTLTGCTTWIIMGHSFRSVGR